MKLSVEKLASIMSLDSQRISDLLNAHWEEVAQYKHLMKLAPDISRYQKLEDEGRLHIVIARDDKDAIVGYSVHFIVKGHPHYMHLVTGEDNIAYLVSELRGTGAHEEMRRFALKTMKERGVQFVTARMKVDHPHDATLRRIGFKPFDMVYGLDLTNWE